MCCAICVAVGAASGAANPSALQKRAGALRHENTAISHRIRSAVLDLYALDSRLAHAQRSLTALGTQRVQLARERQSARLRLAAARQDLRIARRRLALLVHNVYEQQTEDPLAVVLGARSLDAAMTSLDELGRTARQNRQVAAESRAAQTTLLALTRTLARVDARVTALEQAATQTAASLVAAKISRGQYVSTLTAQRHLNASEITKLEARAQASIATAPPATPTAAPTSSATIGAHTLTVVATGYAMGGTTATGLPVGWGTVAVDPSVIPLGTRMTIPGYGEGVAADTGSAVQGATIDLWFPSAKQAHAWGRRVITITFD